MAEMIPMSRAPGYGAQFGQTAATFDTNAAARLDSQLKARSTALSSILGNIEDIAAVSGSGALDPLASAYAGQQGNIFGTDYAGQADRLRLAMSQAKIGALNRSGTGGGGKAKTPPRYAIVRDAEGNIVDRIVVPKPGDLDELRWQYEDQMPGARLELELDPNFGRDIAATGGDSVTDGGGGVATPEGGGVVDVGGSPAGREVYEAVTPKGQEAEKEAKSMGLRTRVRNGSVEAQNTDGSWVPIADDD